MCLSIACGMLLLPLYYACFKHISRTWQIKAEDKWDDGLAPSMHVTLSLLSSCRIQPFSGPEAFCSVMGPNSGIDCYIEGYYFSYGIIFLSSEITKSKEYKKVGHEMNWWCLRKKSFLWGIFGRDGTWVCLISWCDIFIISWAASC